MPSPLVFRNRLKLGRPSLGLSPGAAVLLLGDKRLRTPVPAVCNTSSSSCSALRAWQTAPKTYPPTLGRQAVQCYGSKSPIKSAMPEDTLSSSQQQDMLDVEAQEPQLPAPEKKSAVKRARKSSDSLLSAKSDIAASSSLQQDVLNVDAQEAQLAPEKKTPVKRARKILAVDSSNVGVSEAKPKTGARKRAVGTKKAGAMAGAAAVEPSSPALLILDADVSTRDTGSDEVKLKTRAIKSVVGSNATVSATEADAAAVSPSAASLLIRKLSAVAKAGKSASVAESASAAAKQSRGDAPVKGTAQRLGRSAPGIFGAGASRKPVPAAIMQERNLKAGVADVETNPKYRLEFDGGSRGNPGIGGFGAVLKKLGSSTHVAHLICGCTTAHITNNQAEYMGLLHGIQAAHTFGVKDIVLQGDSQLIVRQLTGQYAVNSDLLRPLYSRVKALYKQGFTSVEPVHVMRAENADADALANLAQDAWEIGSTLVSSLAGKKASYDALESELYEWVRSDVQATSMQLPRLLVHRMHPLLAESIMEDELRLLLASQACPLTATVVVNDIPLLVDLSQEVLIAGGKDVRWSSSGSRSNLAAVDGVPCAVLALLQVHIVRLLMVAAIKR